MEDLIKYIFKNKNICSKVNYRQNLTYNKLKGLTNIIHISLGMFGIFNIANQLEKSNLQSSSYLTFLMSIISNFLSFLITRFFIISERRTQKYFLLRQYQYL